MTLTLHRYGYCYAPGVRGHNHWCSDIYKFTVKPELAVNSIKQPTCLKQPNRMFPSFNCVLIFASAKQPPALSSHFLCFPWMAAYHRFDFNYLRKLWILIKMFQLACSKTASTLHRKTMTITLHRYGWTWGQGS